MVRPAVRKKRALRHAVEIRHPSFLDETFVRLLRKHGAALVVSDSTAGWPYAEDLTADFVYMRLHGTETLYSGAYTDEALNAWTHRIMCLGKGNAGRGCLGLSRSSKPRSRASRDIFCYFDNDQKVQAPFDAERLRELLEKALASIALMQSSMTINPPTPRVRVRPTEGDARRGHSREHNELSDVFGVISDAPERARGWCFEMDENEGTRTKTRCAG